MKTFQESFLNLLTKEENREESHLSLINLSQLYIHAALLATTLEYIKEQNWLLKRETKENTWNKGYQTVISTLIQFETPSLSFLKDLLINTAPLTLKTIKKRSELLEKLAIETIVTKSNKEKKDFLKQTLREISSLFVLEENFQTGRSISEGHRGPCLYRAFDRLDRVLELDYDLDKAMDVSKDQKERLYERTGIGVQSGYSTILLALNAIEAKTGALFVDLGSGYGRVGLTCSLMREDIHFIGYEYVGHRVDVANRASKNLDLSDKLKFVTQDLSQHEFKIPSADIYYLYDPFTKETYASILKQIEDFSYQRKVTVITKGNARTWIEDMAKENSWPAPLVIDEGNLCVFYSE